MAKVQLVRWVLVWNDNQNVMARLVAFNDIVRPITDETFVQLGLIDVHCGLLSTCRSRIQHQHRRERRVQSRTSKHDTFLALEFQRFRERMCRLQ